MADTNNLDVKAPEKVEHHTCPRCGFDLTSNFSKIPEETIKDYFKSSLAQVPFRKTYQLFGGALEVEFEEATGKLLQLQEGALRSKNDVGDMGMSDAMDFAMLPSLVSISYKQPGSTLGQQIYNATESDRIKYLTEAKLPDTLCSMPIVKLQAIRNAFAAFAKLCGDLVVAAQDANFWTGVGRD